VYAKLPEHIIQEVKNRTSIIEVIGQYIELKRAGRSHTGVCPFHNENAPSFHVSEEKAFFHCFGCKASGDVINFIQRIENLSFMEAVETLAERAGVELPDVKKMSEQERRQLSEKDQLFEINRAAMEFFEQQLLSRETGAPALAYLQKRRIAKEMVTRFRLGYAPDNFTALSDNLTKKGYPARLIEKAGVASPGKRGGYYDHFRNRLMFPIIMQNEKVVGFGGRILGGDDPRKYINTPETPIFVKSANLYGYHAARTAITKKERVVIVEGNVDVVMMHQFGFDECVATLGTALTEQHLRLLKRMTKNLILLYDGDEAGKKAMYRSLDLFLQLSLNARAVILPGGHDPDSFLLEHGAEALEERLTNSRYLFDVWLEAQYAARDGGPRGVAECLNQLAPMLAKISDTVEKGLYIQKIARELGVAESSVQQALRQHLNRKNWEGPPAQVIVRRTANPLAERYEAAEEMLFELLVRFPDQIGPSFLEHNTVARMDIKPLRELCVLVLERQTRGEPIEAAELLSALDDPEWKNRVAGILMRAEDMDGEQIARSFADSLKALAARSLQSQIDSLNRKLRDQAVDEADDKERLAQELMILYQQMQQLRAGTAQ